MTMIKKLLPVLACLSSTAAFSSDYPLTIDNCGHSLTFNRSPERVVALGQNTAEILLMLGLQEKIVATAFWPTQVLPQLAKMQEKIPTLTVEIPTLESILAKNPDFVPAQLPLLLGPESKVAKRSDFSMLDINSYMSPGVCATKKSTGDMYGTRHELWDMTFVYEEIKDLSKIFDVEERGEALIADFKQREAALRQEFKGNKKDLSFVFWFSSPDPSADAYVGGKNGASGFIANVLNGHNGISSESEWPTVGWESIIAIDPDVIVVSSLDRNRWTLDRAEEKIKFLKNDPTVSQLRAVQNNRIAVMDGQAMNPTIRTLFGAEQVAKQLRDMELQ